jgi:hypothetical protein
MKLLYQANIISRKFDLEKKIANEKRKEEFVNSSQRQKQ